VNRREAHHRDTPKAAHLLLLSVQIAGVFLIIWKELPDLRQLALSPSRQLQYIRYDDFATIGAVVAMQAAYWYRLRCIPIPNWTGKRGPRRVPKFILCA
jgi:hypothetical protein